MDVPPPGYTPPVTVYLVEEPNVDGEIGQVGGFFAEEEAQQLLRRLTDEGRQAHINLVPIHRRVVDYDHDR